jgi:hypothetical protein
MKARCYLLASCVIAVGAIELAGCATKDYTTYQFKSTDQLAGVIGWQCVGGDEVETRNSIARFGFMNDPCDDGYINLWNSDAKRDEIQGKPFNAMKPGTCRIEGGNWTVGGAQYQVEEAAKKLGGEKTCV